MNEIERFADTRRTVRMVGKLFDRWGLTKDERGALLIGDLSRLNSVLANEDFSPIQEDMGRRCSQLLHIHRCLRLLFPENRVLVYSWIKTPNRVFNGSSPLQVMINEGTAGYERVIRYLDNAISR